MDIKRNYIERSTIQHFAEKHSLTMVINERNLKQNTHLRESDRYYAQFEGSEVKAGGMLCGAFGNGRDESEAIADYAPKISGKVLVFNAMGDDRMQINVPLLCGD